MKVSHPYLWAILLILVAVACSGDSEPPKSAHPAVNALISDLESQGVDATRSRVTTSDEYCLDEYESVLHAFFIPDGARFDLYPFADEFTASVAASQVPLDADCVGLQGVVDWNIEVSYFQCGAVIAFIRSVDEGVLNAFQELCGTPFAVAEVRGRSS